MRMKTRSLRSEGVTPLEHAKGHILNEVYALAHQSIDDAKQGWVTPFARGEIMTDGEAKKVIKHYRKIYNKLSVQWGFATPSDELLDVDAEVKLWEQAEDIQ